ncbi:transposase [Streptomyces iranensis]|uniref:transposase n=1 Tax=Streptomyces iranensis TaxID=576784 RepID=UPI0035585137
MSLTDAQWARIEPLLPDRTPVRGGRWRDHREVIDVTAFKFQTGKRWVHLPVKYGNWRGVYDTADVGRRQHLGVGVHRSDGPRPTPMRTSSKASAASPREDRHFLRSSGHPRVFPALGKIRLKTDPGAVRLHNGRSPHHRSVQGFQASTH